MVNYRHILAGVIFVIGGIIFLSKSNDERSKLASFGAIVIGVIVIIVGLFS